LGKRSWRQPGPRSVIRRRTGATPASRPRGRRDQDSRRPYTGVPAHARQESRSHDRKPTASARAFGSGRTRHWGNSARRARS